MKKLPRHPYQTIGCGLFAVVLAWSTTASGQQDRFNPLRQSASEPPATAAPAADGTAVSAANMAPAENPPIQAVAKSAPAKAGNPVPATTGDSQVRQVAYQTTRTAATSTRTASVAAHGHADHAHPVSHAAGGGMHVQDDGFIVPEGVFQKDGIFQKGGMVQKGGSGDCGTCNGGGCLQCCLPCIPLSLDNVEFFAGTQGFSGPANRGGTGSFGFHEGFNIGMALPCSNECIGVQFGLRATQDNLSGAGFPADGAGNSLFTDSTRTQTFMTLGLFRRVDWGMQGGIAVDYLADNWYADVQISQLRGEASWVFPCTHELGFMFSTAADEDQQVSTFSGGGPLTEIWEATNQYAFFYRHRPGIVEGADARIFAGWSGDNDGIIGADMRLPLSDSLALELGASYLVPDQPTTGAPGGAHEEESWNLAMSLVWYPGCRSAFGGDYFRPLLNVADNGSFRVNRR